jgi:single-strand DNA-binding protein
MAFPGALAMGLAVAAVLALVLFVMLAVLVAVLLVFSGGLHLPEHALDVPGRRPEPTRELRLLPLQQIGRLAEIAHVPPHALRMGGVNRVLLSGRLTRDPELRHTRHARAVCHFSLACGRHHTDRSGTEQEETVFVDVEAWSGLGERVAEHLGKGESALVEGRLRLDRWEDADGRNRSRLCVVAENIKFLAAAPRRAPPPRKTTRPTSLGATAVRRANRRNSDQAAPGSAAARRAERAAVEHGDGGPSRYAAP